MEPWHDPDPPAAGHVRGRCGVRLTASGDSATRGQGRDEGRGHASQRQSAQDKSTPHGFPFRLPFCPTAEIEHARTPAAAQTRQEDGKDAGKSGFQPWAGGVRAAGRVVGGSRTRSAGHLTPSTRCRPPRTTHYRRIHVMTGIDPAASPGGGLCLKHDLSGQGGSDPPLPSHPPHPSPGGSRTIDPNTFQIDCHTSSI